MKSIDCIFVLLIATLSLSKLEIFGYNVNKPVGWLTLIVISFVMFTIFRDKIVIGVLLVLMVTSRFIALTIPNAYLFYDTINASLFFLAGLVVFSTREIAFFKQILLLICICAPIMFLQMAGVPWVQYHTYGQDLALKGGFESTLFQSGALLNLSHAQFRPAGILWSNQPMGLLISFSACYLLFHKIHLKWRYYFLIGSVVVLSTSYLVYLSYIIIIISILLIPKRLHKIPKIKILTGTLAAYLLFFVIFPGINNILWDPYDILNKVWVRMVDLQVAGINIYSLPFSSGLESILIAEKLPQLNALYRITNSVEYKSYSIIGTIYRKLFLQLIVIFGLLSFVYKLFRRFPFQNEPLLYSKIFALVVLILYVVINPQFDWSLYSFFLAFPLSICYPNFVNRNTIIKMV